VQRTPQHYKSGPSPIRITHAVCSLKES